MKQTIVMSLGGSLIAPDKIDITFLKAFRRLILDFTATGNRAILICGGGDTCRQYQKSARIVNPQIKDRDLDWVGIAATKLNAELVSGIFGDKAYESIAGDPEKKVATSKKIIVGAGYMPGSSSDLDAVLTAKTYGANTVINLSNITNVYDKDPRKFKDAKKYTKMSWTELRKLVGEKWVPGAHVPFDPIATKLGQKLGLKLVIMKGNDLASLKKLLAGKEFTGTTVE